MENLKGFVINSEDDINKLFDALVDGTIDNMIKNESEEIVADSEIQAHYDWLDNWLLGNKSTTDVEKDITYEDSYSVCDYRRENKYWKVRVNGDYVGNLTSDLDDRWFFSEKGTKTLHPVFNSPDSVKEFISNIYN